MVQAEDKFWWDQHPIPKHEQENSWNILKEWTLSIRTTSVIRQYKEGGEKVW